MKKIILLAIVAIVFTGNGFAQGPQVPKPDFMQKRQTGENLSNQEIANVIAMSREANLANGVFNPDRVREGQLLTFKASDGFDTTVVVEKNQSQWRIVQSLGGFIKNHGKIIPYPDPIDTAKVKGADIPEGGTTVSDPSWWEKNAFWIKFWASVIGFMLLLLLFYYWRSQYKDPVTSGTPIIEGGVAPANAFAHMREVARRLFPGEDVDITEVEKGRLSVRRGFVRFLNFLRGRIRTFQNVPGYRGRIIRNGELENEYIYFLEPCGNDVRRGKGFRSSEVIFVPDFVQPEILITQQKEREEVQNKAAEEEAKEFASWLSEEDDEQEDRKFTALIGELVGAEKAQQEVNNFITLMQAAAGVVQQVGPCHFNLEKEGFKLGITFTEYHTNAFERLHEKKDPTATDEKPAEQ